MEAVRAAVDVHQQGRMPVAAGTHQPAADGAVRRLEGAALDARQLKRFEPLGVDVRATLFVGAVPIAHVNV